MGKFDGQSSFTDETRYIVELLSKDDPALTPSPNREWYVDETRYFKTKKEADACIREDIRVVLEDETGDWCGYRLIKVETKVLGERKGYKKVASKKK